MNRSLQLSSCFLRQLFSPFLAILWQKYSKRFTFWLRFLISVLSSSHSSIIELMPFWNFKCSFTFLFRGRWGLIDFLNSDIGSIFCSFGGLLNSLNSSVFFRKEFRLEDFLKTTFSYFFLFPKLSVKNYEFRKLHWLCFALWHLWFPKSGLENSTELFSVVIRLWE